MLNKEEISNKFEWQIAKKVNYCRQQFEELKKLGIDTNDLFAVTSEEMFVQKCAIDDLALIAELNTNLTKFISDFKVIATNIFPSDEVSIFTPYLKHVEYIYGLIDEYSNNISKNKSKQYIFFKKILHQLKIVKSEYEYLLSNINSFIENNCSKEQLEILTNAITENKLNEIGKEDNIDPFPIEKLPADILFNVLNHLPINDLVKLLVVNNFFLAVVSDPIFWRNKVHWHFPHIYNRFIEYGSTIDWKKHYLDTAHHEYRKYTDKTIWELFGWSKDGKVELLKLYSVTYKLNSLQDINDCNLLHWAAFNGHLETVKFLLGTAIKVNDKNVNSFNATELALHNGHMDVVNFLLTQGGTIDFSKTSNLQLSLNNGHVEAVKYLLDNNVIDFKKLTAENLFLTLQAVNNFTLTRLFFDNWSQFHREIDDYQSLLRKAMRNGHCDLTFILLKLINIDVLQQQFSTPIKEILEAAAQQNKVSLIEFIYEHFPKVIRLDQLFSIAASFGSNDVVEFLLAKGANCNVSENGFYPLAKACEKNHIKVVELLLDNHAVIDAYNQSDRKVTAFILAVANNHLEIAKLLIEKGCNINLPDSTGRAPLAYAVGYEANLEMIQLLLSNNAEVNTCDEHGSTPLHIAADFGQTEAIEMLIEKGAKIVLNDEGETPFSSLIKTAARIVRENNLKWKSIIQAFQALLNLGQIEVDRDLNSPLHILCGGTNKKLIPLIDFFIDQGIDINTRNNFGMTPLHCAVKNLDIFEHLLNKGADLHAIDNDGETVLHYACKNHYNHKLENLIIQQGLDINVKSYHGITPLHYLAQYTNLETIQEFIAKGPDIKQRTKEGDTILHFAVKRTSFYSKPMINWLLQQGFDINQTNKEGITPLHAACKEGDLKVITLLIKNGADKDAVDQKGNGLLHFLLQSKAYDLPRTLAAILNRFSLDINYQNSEGANVLHYLAANDTLEPEKWDILVSRGARCNIIDNKNKTPIDYLLEKYQSAKENSSGNFLSIHVIQLIKIFLYKSRDFDIKRISIFLDDKYLSSEEKDIIANALKSHKFFQEAIQLLEHPPLILTLPNFLSPIKKETDRFLFSKIDQLLEMSKSADMKYFEKCLYIYLNHCNKLPEKFLRHLLTSHVVLTSNYPKTLLLLAAYAKEKRFLSMSNDDIHTLYQKAAKLFEAEGELELANFAREQTKDINEQDNLSL